MARQISSRLTVSRKYEVCCAHYLPHVPEHHKCRRVHGHNYIIEVYVSGFPDRRGFVIDYYELDQIFEDKIYDVIDHQCLNDIEGLENPTAEALAEWVMRRMQGAIDDEVEGWPEQPPAPLLVRRVDVYETADSKVTYELM